MLDKELEYYIKNQDELVKYHFGRYVIIKDEGIVGNNNKDFSSVVEAILYAKNILKLNIGTFLIQQCMPGKESYTKFFHSTRAFFTYK